MKILIVDDKEENLYLLDAMLKGSGYDVVSALNGKEALEKLHAEEFDMIISDILMPIMDGFTLCRECKREQKLKEIPFVFYTATYKDKRDEELALKLGADKYLLKPMEPEKLIDTIQGLFRDIGEGKIGPKKPVLVEEEETFKLYSERLIKKLEKKMLDLESETAQRKVYAEQLERVNRILHAIRNVNQLIVRENDRQRLIQATCDNLTKIGGYYNTWVALFDESGGLAATAEAGLGKNFLPIVQQLKRGDSVTCVQQALKQAGVIVIKDPLSTCSGCPMAKHYSGRCGIAIRFEHDSKVYGLLVASVTVDLGEYEEERSLIREVVGDIAFALASIEKGEQKKRAEEALRDSEERFRLIAENSPDYIVQTDTQGNVVYSSPAIERISGRSPKEIAGRNFTDILPPTSLSIARTVFKKVAEGETVANVKVDLLHRNGSLVPVEVGIAPIMKNKEVVGFLGIARDITERKQAEEELKQSNTALYKVMHDTIQAMAVTCEMRDPYTAGHQQQVSKLVVAIAEELHLSDKEQEGLRVAALVHDIGKMSIPAEILSKPGKLNTMEFDLVKGHVQASYDILKGIDFPWPVAQIVCQHHERMDGSGYPNALSGKDIVHEARVLAVADVVEAMVSHRPYRPALGIEIALVEISNNRGKLYDADVVDACLTVFRDKGFKFE
jgi:PAS domain S-box-containing protein/putative nucleotidyltransferase with HDIG domain